MGLFLRPGPPARTEADTAVGHASAPAPNLEAVVVERRRRDRRRRSLLASSVTPLGGPGRTKDLHHRRARSRHDGEAFGERYGELPPDRSLQRELRRPSRASLELGGC
ncbi:hypothetical protein [Nonomuraea rubra]|uniref:hypothetical protein n=1 Tax=Nonomuraea rubra TaxID=46180 RepID=UPI0031E70838